MAPSGRLVVAKEAWPTSADSLAELVVLPRPADAGFGLELQAGV